MPGGVNLLFHGNGFQKKLRTGERAITSKCNVWHRHSDSGHLLILTMRFMTIHFNLLRDMRKAGGMPPVLIPFGGWAGFLIPR